MHGKQRARPARAFLLTALLAFALLQFVPAAFIEYCWPQLHDPGYTVRVAHLHSRLKNAPAKLVVMLGSSRALNAVCGSSVETSLAREMGQPVIVYNLATPRAGSLIELLTFARLRDDGIRPDLVLIEVFPALLGLHFTADSDWLPVEQLTARDLTLLPRYHLPCRGLRRAWRGGWPVPWYTCRAAILAETLPYLMRSCEKAWPYCCDASGWMPPITTEITADLRSQMTAIACDEYTALMKKFDLEGPAPEALRNLLEACSHESIPAALILLPEGPTFQKCYPEGVEARVEAFLAELSRQYGTPVINSRDWLAEEDFMDSHHILANAAPRYTKRLAGELILPMLRHDHLTPARR
jgi:hypothetical protein